MGRWMLLLFGVLLIGLLSYFCFMDKFKSIENDLISEAKSIYLQKKMNWVDVGIKGDNLSMTRILTLSGMAPTPEKKLEAGFLAKNIEGITSINNQIVIKNNMDEATPIKAKELNESIIKKDEPKVEMVTLKTEDPQNSNVAKSEIEPKIVTLKTEDPISESIPSPYEIVITKGEDKKVTFGGYVSDIDIHNRLIDEAKEIFGDLNVVDNIAEAKGSPDSWHESIKLGMDKLNLVDYGQVTITDTNFNFEAYVGDQKIKNNLILDLKKSLNSSYSGTYSIEAPVTPIEIKDKDNEKEAKTDTHKVVTPVVSTTVTSNKVDVDDNSKLDIAKTEVIDQNIIKTLSCEDRFKNLLSKNKIYFEYDKSNIKSKSYPLLDELVNIAKECPDDKILIEGHTDSDGSKIYNQKLSDKRAKIVKEYFINGGISEDRVDSIGYGEIYPVATNSTPEGKEKNRRIEFKIKGVE